MPDDDLDLNAIAALEEREDLSFRAERDLRRREKHDALTPEERRVLEAFRRSPAARAMEKIAQRLKSPEMAQAMAAYNSMPKHHQARFRNRKVAEARRDPLFQSYIRRLQRPTSHGRRRDVAPARPRPRSRRAGASSRTSSADPGGSDSDSPPPPELRLWRHPRYGLCNSNLMHALAVAR